MLGLDFGTTNSAVARAGSGGAARLATFPLDGRQTATFRSVLYFSPERAAFGQAPRALAGPEALMGYRDAGGDAGGRFMQSLKSFLASRLFDGTYVFGWKFTLEQLLRRGVPPSAVERVFLTGGSSLVPSVRAIFAERFGAERVRGGDELITVARGLALLAAES